MRLLDLCLKHSLDHRTNIYYEQNSIVVPVCGDPSSFGHSLNEHFAELTTLTIADHLLGNERAKSIFASHRNFTHLKSIRLVSVNMFYACFLIKQIQFFVLPISMQCMRNEQSKLKIIRLLIYNKLRIVQIVTLNTE